LAKIEYAALKVQAVYCRKDKMTDIYEVRGRVTGFGGGPMESYRAVAVASCKVSYKDPEADPPKTKSATRSWQVGNPLTDSDGRFSFSFDWDAVDIEGDLSKANLGVTLGIREPRSGSLLKKTEAKHAVDKAFVFEVSIGARHTTELKIKLDWSSNPEEPRMLKVISLLHAFNDRLYDATDGQWRITVFRIYDADIRYVRAEDPGVGHILEFKAAGGKKAEHGHTRGRPNRPRHFHVALDQFVDNDLAAAYAYGGAMVMEFLHSWTGVRDEYNSEGGSYCPADIATASSDRACLLGASYSQTELCRDNTAYPGLPGNHNHLTKQHESRGMACYEWIARVMHDTGITDFTVPDRVIFGPSLAIPASIEIVASAPVISRRKKERRSG
jgi:hypothetical protein